MAMAAVSKAALPCRSCRTSTSNSRTAAAPTPSVERLWMSSRSAPKNSARISRSCCSSSSSNNLREIGAGKRSQLQLPGDATLSLWQTSRRGMRNDTCGAHFRSSRTFPGCQERRLWKVNAGLKETELTEQQWGPPVRLGTAKLPQDVDLEKLRSLLYQWGNSLTQNANLPLPVPLKVDKVEGGVRLGYVKVTNGQVEDLVHIDVIVTPSSQEDPKAMFRAIRNGKLKNSVPPGEPLIMQSLLIALKKSLELARTS